MIVSVTSDEVKSDPNRIWNEFIGLIADEQSASDPIQRPAHLVFIYESEVQNGGHFQYFQNVGSEYLDDTVAALSELGAMCQSSVLKEAGIVWSSVGRVSPTTAEEFVEEAFEGEFSTFDEQFHECSLTLIEHLENYLVKFQDSFVRISDSSKVPGYPEI